MLDTHKTSLGISTSKTEASTTKYKLIQKIAQDLARAEAALGWHLSKKETGGAVMGDKEAELKSAEFKVESLRKTLEEILDKLN